MCYTEVINWNTHRSAVVARGRDLFRARRQRNSQRRYVAGRQNSLIGNIAYRAHRGLALNSLFRFGFVVATERVFERNETPEVIRFDKGDVPMVRIVQIRMGLSQNTVTKIMRRVIALRALSARPVINKPIVRRYSAKILSRIVIERPFRIFIDAVARREYLRKDHRHAELHRRLDVHPVAFACRSRSPQVRASPDKRKRRPSSESRRSIGPGGRLTRPPAPSVRRWRPSVRRLLPAGRRLECRARRRGCPLRRRPRTQRTLPAGYPSRAGSSP